MIDAMFTINTTPLKHTLNISAYAKTLFNRFAVPYFKRGAKEVHMIFDQPGDQTFNPKGCEQKRRDDSHKQKEHNTHIQFTPQTTIPKPWREYLQCWECKRSLVEAIGLSYLQTARLLLHPRQQLVVAGCFSGTAENTAWRITEDDLLPQPEPIYRSTAREADIRLWRHVISSQAHNILIYSPDTDVYNIGLGLSAKHIIQLNPPHCDEQYLQTPFITSVS